MYRKVDFDNSAKRRRGGEAPPLSRGASRFWGCFLGTIVAWCVLFGFLASGAKRFVSYGIGTDITEYIAALEEMDIDEDRKADLVGRLVRLRKAARDGEHVGMMLWIDYSKSIEILLEDHELTEKELLHLEEEVRDLESR